MKVRTKGGRKEGKLGVGELGSWRLGEKQRRGERQLLSPHRFFQQVWKKKRNVDMEL
jgi:hypothetical protein